jgi:hypothetical protein
MENRALNGFERNKIIGDVAKDLQTTPEFIIDSWLCRHPPAHRSIEEQSRWFAVDYYTCTPLPEELLAFAHDLLMKREKLGSVRVLFVDIGPLRILEAA